MSWLTVSTPLLRKDQLCIQFEGVTETLVFMLSLILCEETLIRMRFGVYGAVYVMGEIIQIN